jgi:hypothetical protein
MDNRSNSRANTCVAEDFTELQYLLDFSKPIFRKVYLLIHDNFSNRWVVPAINRSSFCPISLMVVYWTTMAFTGNGGLGFDSGEGA